MRFFVTLVSFFAFASPAFSEIQNQVDNYAIPVVSNTQVLEDFEDLRTQAIDYTIFGTICEHVARLRLQEIYGTEDYKFITGIAYSGRGRTLGELDVVILRKSDKEAIIVSEVKCWRDLAGGLAKAKKQLNRFERNIAQNSVDSMQTTTDQTPYSCEQFDEDLEYMTISQLGGKDVGFTMDISLDMEEVKELRNMLMDCQAKGSCPRAK